jgi:hypothetical protein
MKEEQGQHQNEKTKISLAEIFFLNPEVKKDFIQTQHYATPIVSFRCFILGTAVKTSWKLSGKYSGNNLGTEAKASGKYSGKTARKAEN